MATGTATEVQRNSGQPLDNAFRAIGEVRFARATVGRQFVCTDGTFDNQHGTALDLTGVVCQGDVLVNSTGSEGRFFRTTAVTG